MLKPKPPGRRIIVLGELKGLGKQSKKLHADLIPKLINSNISLVFTLGEKLFPVFNSLPKKIQGGHAETINELNKQLIPKIIPNDIILVKGPRKAKEHLARTVTALRNLTQLLTIPSPKNAHQEIETLSDIKNYAGIIYHIPSEASFIQSNNYWKEKILYANKILNKHNKGLILFLPNEVDMEKNKVKGYCLSGSIPKMVFADLPKIILDWLIIPKSETKLVSSDLYEFKKWAFYQNINIVPGTEISKIFADKYLTYRLCKNINPELHPVTDIFEGSLEQLSTYTKNYPLIYLKPLLGARGNGILTLKTYHNYYKLNIYASRKKKHTCQCQHLQDCLEKISTQIKNTKYIIQEGIETLKYNDSAFDIRVILINDGTQWQFLHMLRLGESHCELSNISFGGYFYPTEEILNEIMNEKDVADTLQKIKKVVDEITGYFESASLHNVNEIGLDILVDVNKNLHLAEMNTKPGYGTAQLYKSLTAAPMDKYIEKNYTIPHANYIATYLLTWLKKNASLSS